jgi:phosphoribosyl-ATP pyrophosphohydrolase
VKVGTEILGEVFAMIEDCWDSPKEGSCISNLLASGRALEKMDGEAREFVEAGQGSKRQTIVRKASGPIFREMVLPAVKGVNLEKAKEELLRRRRCS